VFGFLKTARPYSDDQLGLLERKAGFWRGECRLGTPASELTFQLKLAGTRTAPDPKSLALARELPSRFIELIPDIEKRLFEHYEPYRDASPPGTANCCEMTAPHDVWANVLPFRVEIGPFSHGHGIEIAFDVSWDEEHIDGAQIQNWKLIDFCGSVPPS
jgi:hypothetical protein